MGFVGESRCEVQSLFTQILGRLFNGAERVMQHGYLYKLHLLPRYHTKVEDSLNDHSYMHERYIDFNPPTAEIQTSLLALVQKFLLQLRKCKQVDVDSLAKGKDSPWDLFRDYSELADI